MKLASSQFRIIFSAGSELCQVISGSVSGVIPGAFVVLVQLETLQTHTFHLLLYEGGI